MARRKNKTLGKLLVVGGLGLGGYWLWKTGRFQALVDQFSGGGGGGTTPPDEGLVYDQIPTEPDSTVQTAVDMAAQAAAVLAAWQASQAVGAAEAVAVENAAEAAAAAGTGIDAATLAWNAVGVSVPLWLGLSPEAPKLAGDIGHWLDKTIFGIEPWEPGQVIKRTATTPEQERATWARKLPPGTSIKGLTTAQIKALVLQLQGA